MTSRFVFACLLLSAAAFAQDPAARGAALLADSRSAVGGADRLRAVKTLQARGDFKRIAGQATIEGELVVFAEFPDKLRREEDLSLPGGGPAIVRTEVLNGADTWEANTGGGGGPFIFRGRGGGDVIAPGGGREGDGRDGGARGRGALDPEQLRQFQLRARQADLARLSLALLLATSDPVTWVGTAESPDGTADVLEITPAGGPPLRLFLDTVTHLPLMITWQGVAPQIRIGRRGGGGDDAPPTRPGPTTLRMTLGDYKAINGVKLPHFITRGADGQTTEEWTVSSYRLNPALKADTFIRK